MHALPCVVVRMNRQRNDRLNSGAGASCEWQAVSRIAQQAKAIGARRTGGASVSETGALHSARQDWVISRCFQDK